MYIYFYSVYGENMMMMIMMIVRRFLDPNISNCRWASVSFPALSSFEDCFHAYRSCNLPETLCFKKRKTSTAQAHDTFGHLVLLDYRPYTIVQVLYV